jgi:hypothetical protein
MLPEYIVEGYEAFRPKKPKPRVEQAAPARTHDFEFSLA